MGKSIGIQSVKATRFPFPSSHGGSLYKISHKLVYFITTRFPSSHGGSFYQISHKLVCFQVTRSLLDYRISLEKLVKTNSLQTMEDHSTGFHFKSWFRQIPFKPWRVLLQYFPLKVGLFSSDQIPFKPWRIILQDFTLKVGLFSSDQIPFKLWRVIPQDFTLKVGLFSSKQIILLDSIHHGIKITLKSCWCFNINILSYTLKIVLTSSLPYPVSCPG